MKKMTHEQLLLEIFGRTHPFKVGDILEVTKNNITFDAIVTKLIGKDGIEYAEITRTFPERRKDEEIWNLRKKYMAYTKRI